MDFIGFVRDIGVSKKHSKHNDDTFVDRLNYKYTVTILVLFSILITGGQYAGNPINCWVPGHFTGNYEKYAERICWVSSTYNIPMHEDIPNEEPERKDKMLKYYQWTAFILLFQALLFYLPRMIWRSMNDKSGLDIQSLVDVVHNYQKNKSEFLDKDKVMQYLTTAFDRYVSSVNTSDHISTNINEQSTLYRRKTEQETHDPEYKRTIALKQSGTLFKKNNDDDNDDEYDEDDVEYERNDKSVKLRKIFRKTQRGFHTFCISMGKRYGNYLMILFIFVKVIYTTNSILQLFILNQFLGNDFILLGFEVLSKVWRGEDWSQLKRFPRITLCDFRVREVGVTHRYTVQCVLSINLFNEKIFIFIWYWLCLVSIFNLIDLVSWTYNLIINSNERYAYIKKRMFAFDEQTDKILKSMKFNKKLFSKFVNTYLREDGVLALRLLSRNAHDLIVSEVITKLYEIYLNRYHSPITKNPNDEQLSTAQNIEIIEHGVLSRKTETH